MRSYHPITSVAVVLVILLGFAVFFISFVTAPFVIIGGYVLVALVRDRRQGRSR